MSDWRRGLGQVVNRLPTRYAGALRAVRGESWLALAVGVGGALLRLNGLATPVDSYDEGVYLASLRSLAAGHQLYSQVYSAQPPLFLLALLPVYRLFGQTLLAARLGVFAFALVGLWAAWRLGCELAGPRAGLIALALLAFDPVTLAQARSVQAEAPALAVMLAGLAAAAAYRRRPLRRYAALAGALLMASLLIKLFTVPALAPTLWLLWWPSGGLMSLAAWGRARRWPARAAWGAWWRAVRPATLAFAAGGGVALALTALPVAGDLGVAWRQVIGLHVGAEGTFGASRAGNLGLVLGTWWELPLAALGLAAGVLGWARRAWDGAMLAAWGLLCVIVLVLQAPLFAHHLALLPPPFALAAALLPDIAGLPTRMPGRLRAALGNATATLGQPEARLTSLALAAALVLGVVTCIAQQAYQQAHPPLTTLAVAGDLASFTQPGDLVVTDDQIIADLANRQVPPALVDTSAVRIQSGDLTTAQVIAAASDPRVTAVLWYSGRFDALPGLRAWVAAHFVAVLNYGGGRELYLRLPPNPPVGQAETAIPGKGT